MRSASRLPAGLSALLAILLATCSNDESPVTPADDIPPASVADLSVIAVTDGSAVLTWTAPGDDDQSGTAAVYDVRYALSAITPSTWGAALQAVGEPAPPRAGALDSFTVMHLNSNTRYYFAMKTADEKRNWSGISNLDSAATLESPDVTPPAAVADLAVIDTTFESVTLSWTAPGDDGEAGTATSYDIRYHASPITYGNWDAATPVSNPPAPRPGGARDTIVVNGLREATTYYFALMSADEKPNWSPISNGAGVTTPPYRDVTPPAAILDLSAIEPRCYSVKLSWTTPADDTTAGLAAAYDIRYARAPIDASTWAAAVECSGEPVPGAAGARDSFTVDGLDPETTWHFAMRTADGSGNWSALSNGTSAATATHGCWTALRPGGACCTHASTVWNGNLAVSVYDGSDSKVISWDGNAWTELGPKLNGRVNVLAVYGNRLVAGGYFTEIGGVPANRIAAWDGSSWAPLGSGVGGVPYEDPPVFWPEHPAVASLAIYQDRLIVGGYFLDAGGARVNHIAAWDGSSWAPLGSGIEPYYNDVAFGFQPVNALAVFNGTLVAGGAIQGAGGTATRNMACWNGASWQAFGADIGMPIAMAIYDGRLFAGGVLRSPGSSAYDYIASWDGAAWSSLGSGTDDFVRVLCVYGGRLIAAGGFASAGGQPASSIAAWNGAAWSPLGGGLTSAGSPGVSSLSILGDRLVACGSFIAAGGVPSTRYIAAWRD